MPDKPTFWSSARLIAASRASSLAGAVALIILTTGAPFAWGMVKSAWDANVLFQSTVLDKLASIDSKIAAGIERGNALRATDTQFAQRLERAEDRIDRLQELRR